MKQHDFIKDSDANGGDGIAIAHAKKRKLDLIPRLVCLLFAFVLWIYFVNMNDDDVTAEIKVTLDVVGKDTLKSETGQMVYGLDTQEITLVIKGTNRDIKKYSSADYKVTVDVSGISSSGKHTLDVTPELPDTTGLKLSVQSIQPQNVVIYSDYVVTKDVNFEVENVGITTPYTLGEITKSADKVQVTGPAAILSTIEKARFRISETTPFHTSTTYTGFKLDFYDNNGEYVPYDDSLITYSTSDMRVKVSILTHKDMGIELHVDGVALNENQYTVRTDTPVSVSGDPTLLLSSLKDYKIPINITAEELASGVIVKSIVKSDLPEGIILDAGESIQIIITIIKNDGAA